MSSKILAVIDTNVLVSSLLTKNRDSATLKILDYISEGIIRPLYNDEIISEYRSVMNRPKFRFNGDVVNQIIDGIIEIGVNTVRTPYPYDLPDPKDRVFYEVSLSGDSYLVSGNVKHFPVTPKVVTPAEMVAIIDSINQSSGFPS